MTKEQFKKYFPKGFLPRGKKVYFRYHDPILKKSRTMVTDIPMTTEGARRAPKWKENKLYELHNKSLYSTTIPVDNAVKLSAALKNFIQDKSVPNSKDYIKTKTREKYEWVVEIMIKACGDKYTIKYTKNDYVNLLKYLDQHVYYKDKEKRVPLKLSITTISIITGSLSTLWNYLIEKELATENIITPTDPEEKDPDPIDFNDMFTIIEQLKKKKDFPYHYHFIYFMLLCGLRPSSAIVQLKENIKLDEKRIKIKNVKVGRRGKRKSEYYWFPLYPALYDFLINDMKIEQGDKGRLFPQFSLKGKNYTNSLRFWDRLINNLNDPEKHEGKKLINGYYNLKQIRSTFATFAVNVLKIPIYVVKNLMDHANIKVTEKHYAFLFLETMADSMKDFSLSKFKAKNGNTIQCKLNDYIIINPQNLLQQSVTIDLADLCPN